MQSTLKKKNNKIIVKMCFFENCDNEETLIDMIEDINEEFLALRMRISKKNVELKKKKSRNFFYMQS